MVIAIVAVQRRFGLEGVDRVWGAVVLVWAVFYTFKPSIPFWVGRQPKEPLTGWKKWVALAVAYTLGH